MIKASLSQKLNKIEGQFRKCDFLHTLKNWTVIPYVAELGFGSVIVDVCRK